MVTAPHITRHPGARIFRLADVLRAVGRKKTNSLLMPLLAIPEVLWPQILDAAGGDEAARPLLLGLGSSSWRVGRLATPRAAAVARQRIGRYGLARRLGLPRCNASARGAPHRQPHRRPVHVSDCEAVDAARLDREVSGGTRYDAPGRGTATGLHRSDMDPIGSQLVLRG